MPHEVIMPALGMTQDTGMIVAWRKEVGDAITIGDPLFDVETDKTTMEVEATHAGTLTEIRVSVGTDIPVGQTIAIISGAPSEASADARPNFAPEPATKVETKPATSLVTPTAQSTPSAVPIESQTVRNKPAVLSTPSAATILASPKAKYEAHQRGIDLRRLVDQGIPQPFHVADLDRLQPETATAAPPAMSRLSAKVDLQALDAFVSWAQEKTGRQAMRSRVLATFAAAALRSDNTSDLIVSVLSIRGGERAFPNPDLRRLGEPDGDAAESDNGSAHLTLVDLTKTRLTDYQPPARSGRPTVVLTKDNNDSAVATLHVCEDHLPLPTAARFLDTFAESIDVPALQLL